MQEDFIDWIWKNRQFRQQDLHCVNGERLEILHPGRRNTDSGPDYFDARVKIDGVTWIGNVELHIQASDWIRHRHHHDPMYDNVILHVVHETDMDIFRKDGSRIPGLSLKNRYPDHLLNQYLNLVQGTSTWIPCEKLLPEIPELVIQSCYAVMITERLERKTRHLSVLLNQTCNNWEEAFYIKLAEGFGFRVNNQPFYMLASSLPLSLIRKYCEKEFYCEALLFGQAGMLNEEMKDAYGRELYLHYHYLQRLYSLQPLQKHLWKKGRLRPANFPERRIAQFSALLKSSPALFDSLINCNDFSELKDKLNVTPDNYWKRHYVFDKETPQINASIGEQSILNLIINVIIPFTFYYGRQRGIIEMTDKALGWLEQCETEANSIIRNWNRIGIRAVNALESQALIHLRNEYCVYKKCLNCRIGQHILKK